MVSIVHTSEDLKFFHLFLTVICIVNLAFKSIMEQVSVDGNIRIQCLRVYWAQGFDVFIVSYQRTTNGYLC